MAEPTKGLTYATHAEAALSPRMVCKTAGNSRSLPPVRPGKFPSREFPVSREFPEENSRAMGNSRDGNFPGISREIPGKFPGKFPGISRISGISRGNSGISRVPREIPVPREFPEIREIPEPREIPETREFPRSENFPPVSRETGNSREFPSGHASNINRCQSDGGIKHSKLILVIMPNLALLTVTL